MQGKALAPFHGVPLPLKDLTEATGQPTTHGSLVAQDPSRFGIAETWELDGDRLGLGIFFSPDRPWKTDEERSDVDARLDALARGWLLRSYPWAGAVSTAHTILYYDRFGPGIFKDLARGASGARGPAWMWSMTRWGPHCRAASPPLAPVAGWCSMAWPAGSSP